MNKIKSPLHKGPSKGQVFEQPSLTQPGMAMTVAEMFVKFQQGVQFDADGRLIWDDDDTGEPLPRLNDLTELEEYKIQNREVLKKAKSKPAGPITNESLKKGGDKPSANVVQPAERNEPIGDPPPVKANE